MSAYDNSDELQKIMVDLWNTIKQQPEIAGKLLASKLIVQFHYREPNGLITIDCSDGKEMFVHGGANTLKPTVEMFMKADTAHDFWLGKVNVPMALLTGQMSAKGPVNKALSLLPAIKPAFSLYPAVYKKYGQKSAVSG
ncbi:MAG TPA: SCP2 sterol-binding domain-containing protein [Planktothrix sp.]|jgi:putative sterol carrier protein